MNNTCKAVFIGGSSQSGTSMVNAFLWHHPAVLACPLETCFIVTAHGLMDVVRAVSDEYCFFRLDPILHDFERLMHHHLCSPRSYPYNRFDLAEFFGRERYHQAIDKFFARLSITRYMGDGLTIQPFARVGRVYSPFKLKRWWFPSWMARERSYLYHVERQTPEAALDAARMLLNETFGAKASEEGKQVWCEQTSTNPLFADFLHKLYPTGSLVYMIRDPLDVALAHLAQNWAPPEFSQVCATLHGVYERWFAQRAKLPADTYLEARFEDLAADPEPVLKRVCQAIGISYDSRMLRYQIDVQRLQREQARRDAADLVTYRRVLGPIAEQLGYAVP